MVQGTKSKIEQLVDSEVSIEGKALDYFESAEITADGTAQSTAHGLLDADFAARTPTIVWTEITSIPTGHAGPLTLVKGTHTSTNVVVTGTNDANFKYKVFAI
jgi:hypothetical protein